MRAEEIRLEVSRPGLAEKLLLMENPYGRKSGPDHQN